MIECRMLYPAHRVELELAKEIIERSVRQLCYVDHGDDEQTIKLWLNAAWPGLRTDYVIAAFRDDGRLVGVASMNKSGQIFLNYVEPVAVKIGASAVMLSHLQIIAYSLSLTEVQLVSTMAARHFYYKHGFRDVGPPQKGNGVSWNFPMAKGITSSPTFDAIAEARTKGVSAPS